jgi:hypothetical protein
MSTVPDPFESFRRARAEEGYRARPAPDRTQHTQRASAIIDRLAGGQEPLARDEANADTRRDEASPLVARLALVAAGDADPRRQAEARALLAEIAFTVQRFLDGQEARPPRSGLELEIDYDDLFEFMLNPDVDSLRRAKGI